MTFPLIKHIDDIREAIYEKPEFIIADKGAYQVVNYVYSDQETFLSLDVPGADLLRECRGLKFDRAGKLISRPLHKFWNIGEKEESRLENLDFSIPHVITSKLDGSMIHPCMLEDHNGWEHIRWMTKMGISDVAMQAEAFVATKKNYLEFAKACVEKTYTPIFEWCSPENKIVIDHKEESLTLLAIRENETGYYLYRNYLETVALAWKIPLVPVFSSETDIDKLLKQVAELEDEEGIVIWFSDGQAVKAKGNWYLQLHRTKDAISDERKIVELWVSNSLDDLKPLLDSKDLEKVSKYESALKERVDDLVFELLHKAIFFVANYSRKDFALGPSKELDSLFVSLIFRLWDKEFHSVESVQELVLDTIKKYVTNNANFRKLKEHFLEGLEY